jgi:antitoxin PrlF
MKPSRPRSKLIVSQRGQITLPARARRRIGIKEGGVVTLEERPGELVIRPAAVIEVEIFSDADIARWDEEDRLGDAERGRIRKKLTK